MAPVNIQATANRRPGIERGVLSPYPTVVMDIKLHQHPSNQPIRKGLGNSSLLNHVSSIHVMNPESIVMRIQMRMIG